MKMIRHSLITAVSLAAALALAACGKQDDSAAQMPDAPPAAASSGIPASAPPTMETGAAVTFGALELGSTVDANNKVIASGTSFAPTDTIYAAVDTSGNGNATLAAKWTYQDGQTVHEDSKDISASGPETTAFMISKPSGFPAGDYKVEISLDGNPVASRSFSVK